MSAKFTAVILVLVLVLAAGIAYGAGEIVAYEVRKHGVFTNTKAQMELLVSLGNQENFEKLGELIERYEVGGGKGNSFSFGSGSFGAAAKELYDAEELGLLGDGHEVKLIEGIQNDSVVRVAPVKNYANEKFFVRFVDLKPLTLEQTWQFKMDAIQKKTEQNRKQEQDAAAKARALIPKKEDTATGAPLTREEIDKKVKEVQKGIDALFKKNGDSK